MTRNKILSSLRALWSRWADTPRNLWSLYLISYLILGALAQLSTPYLEIARFARNWQFITLYGGFLVPLSLLIRGLPWHQQYAYALMAIAPIELGAFTLQTSVAYPHNIIEVWLGPRNFTLAMVLLAAWIPYVGNLVVPAFGRWLDGARRSFSAVGQVRSDV
jgi:hypothetical protein